MRKAVRGAEAHCGKKVEEENERSETEKIVTGEATTKAANTME